MTQHNHTGAAIPGACEPSCPAHPEHRAWMLLYGQPIEPGPDTNVRHMWSSGSDTPPYVYHPEGETLMDQFTVETTPSPWVPLVNVLTILAAILGLLLVLVAPALVIATYRGLL